MTPHVHASAAASLVALVVLLLCPPLASQDEGVETRREPAADSGRQDGRSGARRGRGAPRRRPERKKEGLPVRDELVITKCQQCHKVDERGHMTRISYMRKSPEGWETTLKRMVRLHKVYLEPEEARAMLRYLADEHGLTREEAARGLYENERRVHWSEEGFDDDMRQGCAACHTLGRVLNQQRDADEWKLLKATHLAMFPLADFQAFRGGRGGGLGGGGSGGGEIDFEEMSESEREAFRERRQQEARQRGDRADRVLAQLAKDQPLFSESWRSWRRDRREIPIAGAWSLSAYEIGVGRITGTLAISAIDDDAFETLWTLRYPDGSVITRTGKGLVYGGFSWRGRSSIRGAAAEDDETMRETLLLDDDWSGFRGRLFRGGYDEIGIDVELRRRDGVPAVLTTLQESLPIPATAARLDLFGHDFPETLQADDFHLGAGVVVREAQRLAPDRVRLLVDVAEDAEPGKRSFSFRARPGPECLVLHDTVDYIKILPERGFARIGGETLPKQIERFEVVAMHRGPDGKEGTPDDFRIRRLEAAWGLEEFPVRDGDDDVAYVGVIDAASGVFTPGLEGPNPARKWQANNIGDVYVTASCELTVRERLPEPKVEEPADDAGDDAGEPSEDADDERRRRRDRRERRDDPREDDEDAAPAEAADAERPEAAEAEGAAEGEAEGEAEPSARETPALPSAPRLGDPVRKTFRARGHLLVSPPLYARWDRMNWGR